MTDFTFQPLNISAINLDIPYIELKSLSRKTPVRWWSMKTAKEFLGRSERQVWRYIKAGKLQKKYICMGGRRRLYISNLSALALKELLNQKDEKVDWEDAEDIEIEDEL